MALTNSPGRAFRRRALHSILSNFLAFGSVSGFPTCFLHVPFAPRHRFDCCLSLGDVKRVEQGGRRVYELGFWVGDCQVPCQAFLINQT